MNHSTMRNRIHEKQQPAALSTGWGEIRAAADGDSTIVRIYDAIDSWGAPFGVSAEQFAEEISQIATARIEVQINSPGGEVFEGIAIYNALRNHPAHVTTRVDGIAASIASVIAQAGDHRIITESAQLMIHEAWGLAMGPARDLRTYADLLEKENGVIADIYAARSETSREDFLELMTSDTYLTDQEALELGLVDEILVPARQQARAEAASPAPAAAGTAGPVADADGGNEPEAEAKPTFLESVLADAAPALTLTLATAMAQAIAAQAPPASDASAPADVDPNLDAALASSRTFRAAMRGLHEETHK